MADVMIVTDATFAAEVLQSAQPALVDFSAAWCGPCRRLAPIVEEVARDFAGRVKVATLDVDASPETAAQFGVLSVPMLILFKDGQEAGRILGLVPKQKIVDALRVVL